jgi:hypothetical protein
MNKTEAQNIIIPDEAPNFRVFPNPSDPNVDTYVSLQGFKANNLLVVVYDMFGREIYSKVEVIENEGFLFTLSTDGNKLPAGVYLISASANDNVFKQKLIVR